MILLLSVRIQIMLVYTANDIGQRGEIYKRNLPQHAFVDLRGV